MAAKEIGLINLPHTEFPTGLLTVRNFPPNVVDCLLIIDYVRDFPTCMSYSWPSQHPLLECRCRAGFSVLRKIHTDQRASLSHETLVHLFSIKFKDTSCCFDTELSEELIAKCKKATKLSLNKK